jgi:hypothetical protein
MGDSDWASDILTRRSTTGLIVFCAGRPVCWNVKRQAVVSLSSCEAEYYALVRVICVVMFLRTLLKELRLPQNLPSPVYTDNKGARDLALNPNNHHRTKHIDIKVHFIREKKFLKIVDILPVRTDDNRADPFTKMLGSNKFFTHLPYIMGKKIAFKR